GWGTTHNRKINLLKNKEERQKKKEAGKSRMAWWFFDYSHVHYGDVIIGNESPLEIFGIGAIQFKRNLISLGTLEAMGFKFSVDNGVLKAERINNLYYLQGSTVIGAAASVSLYLLTTGRKIKKLRTDNGLEFCNSERGMDNGFIRKMKSNWNILWPHLKKDFGDL
ncbi:hypothetical protein ACJX0J_039735, partial [Zea mays]